MTVHADEVKFRQVLYNLLSNSIKFTPQGGTVRLRADANQDGVTIAVEDSGIGISPTDQKRLFREFERNGKREIAQFRAGLPSQTVRKRK